MKGISKKLVLNEGNPNASIMVVGEAPGEDEDREGRPFMGKAGQLQERYFGRLRVRRPDLFLANLCNNRPPGNKFTALLKTDELEEGLARLNEDIKRVNPNIIIASGNWPMYYLTKSTASSGGPGTGVTIWRGSVVPGVGDFIPAAAGRKVGITFHPAYIIRAQGFGWHPVYYNDLKVFTQRESLTPEFCYPEIEEYIDPPNIEQLAREMAEAPLLSVDIETFGNTLACVGFADRLDRGLCITHENPEGWVWAEQLLRSRAPKVFQFGAFDITFFWRYYNWEVQNYSFDTYIAAANLMQEFPKRLDFMTSLYTPFPFYKEERKVWKATGNMGTLWSYNIKDCIATLWIAQEQQRELERLYGRGM